ncbi:amidophosphoribosyltransferase [Helicobacter equorum]|uniref:amidophosphoribosyltransferase n=1 Tax=Helicobacter equorum TaxID=361872 RepID=UPI000CF0F2BB|nr:amidophosphoribosyltransferase [Helicobacter equorum]
MKDWNEECAVVGVYNVKNATILSYYSLFAMQHRGQEASGISTSDGTKITTLKGNGLVTKVFDEENLKKLQGKSSIGHNRYSTAGEDSINEAQPIFARYSLGEMAIVHNGNLTNAKAVRKMLIDKGAIFQSHLDTENLIHLIANSQKEHLVDRIIDALSYVDGAYCFVFLSRSKMFVVRDRYGLRPLSLGKIYNDDGSVGYIAASETCAFDLVGAEYVRDVAPGEMLIFEGAYTPLNACEPKSVQVFAPKPKPCVFEYMYFSRPDSQVYGKNVYEIRKNMGIELAKEHRLNADIVIPVPDSGVAAALGYAKQSGIDFELGIIRNHYVGRTFIEPLQRMRELKVRLKLNPISSVIQGKEIIVIDDSVVRGTTSKQIVQILRKAGAKKVYLLISAPPTISPCYYGVDTPDRDQLICANKSIEEVRSYIGADFLGFLSIDGMLRSIGGNQEFCKACFDGQYVDEYLLQSAK